jgi:hypothetical protein
MGDLKNYHFRACQVFPICMNMKKLVFLSALKLDQSLSSSIYFVNMINPGMLINSVDKNPVCALSKYKAAGNNS